MSSVNVTWKGTCPARGPQRELVGFLRVLAEHSASRIRGPLPRGEFWEFLEVLKYYRKVDGPLVFPIRIFDHEIKGRILLDPKISSDPSRLHKEMKARNTVLCVVEGQALRETETSCVDLSSLEGRYLLLLSRLRVHGIDFQLFDPRGLYPESNRMSFVFVQSSALSALNGCLAQLEDQARCRLYDNEALSSVDWYVCAPTIHLRYFLEEWTDYFFAWVKYFFVPDLYYWRREDLPQRAAIHKLIDDIGRDADPNEVKDLLFSDILDRFERESDDWIATVGQIA